jgi:hypothetical protein
MEARVAIGANRTFVLRNAVLVYGDGATSFATLHPVVSKGSGPTTLLGAGTGAHFSLPEDVGRRIGCPHHGRDPARQCPGSHTRHDHLVDAGQARVMFFGGTDQMASDLNGAIYPHPALVFKVADRESLRARLGEGRAPH